MEHKTAKSIVFEKSEVTAAMEKDESRISIERRKESLRKLTKLIPPEKSELFSQVCKERLGY